MFAVVVFVSVFQY